MTLTLLNLYNSAASQEWSMYDSGAASTDELEESLVIAINKAVTEILYSYPFNFRQRTHIILALPRINSYDLPTGLISVENSENCFVKCNLNNLRFIKNPSLLDEKFGIPEGFYIKGDKIVFYPTPSEKTMIVVDYTTLAIGENALGDEIFSLKNHTDKVLVPEYLEELFKQAVISRTMLNTISAESDENYSAYKRQSEVAYRLLIKYSKGVGLEKSVKM